MNRLEVERRVHRILDDVEAGRPVEDDRMELKREWPDDFYKTARRVAGHANAARQEPIIWIIGVDEERRVIEGVDAGVDVARWSQQLQAIFENRWAPIITVHNVPRDDKIVVALVFNTEGAPYLVKTANTDRLELPWRSGTLVRSAKRHEVFATLSEPASFPDFEIRYGELTAQANRRVPPDEIFAHTFSISFTLYVVPRSEKAVFFPAHRAQFFVRFDDLAEPISFGRTRWQSLDDDPNVVAEERQIGFRAPGFAKMYASVQIPVVTYPNGQPLSWLVLGHAGSASEVVELRAPLNHVDAAPDIRRWTFGQTE
jgi:hypothetical protein